MLVPTGDPSLLRFGHPDVTTGDTVLPRWDTDSSRAGTQIRRRPHSSFAPTGAPALASGTLMSLQEGTGTSALSLQTAQRDGIILARMIPSLLVCV